MLKGLPWIFIHGWKKLLFFTQSFYAPKMKILPVVFLFLTGIATLTPAARSIMDPHPIGTSVTTTITYGDAYSTAIETYDAAITVTRVMRGKTARDLLKKQKASNREPDPGFEYILACVRFEFAAKGKPGDKTYDLREDQFIAFSSDGSTQYPAAHALLPKLRLAGTLHSGDSAEGWIVLVAARNDRKPFMAFRADVRLISHTGIGPAFRLY
jgi:hypothetical protein